MTTLLDHTDARTADEAAPTTTPALRLRATMAAVRLGFTWMGTRKTLTPGQTARAAETFDAEGRFLSAAKKLLDTKHPAFRSVTAARGQIESYWRSVSLPFPGRVGGRRAHGRVRWLVHRFRSGPQAGSHGHVSSPRLVKRSVRISRTPLS